MVYKRARAARAAAVHSLVYAALKENYLRVLAAQLYNARGIGFAQLYHLRRGENLLHKGYVSRLCKPQARRAGYCRLYFSFARNFLCKAQKLRRFFAHLRKMALVAFKQYFVSLSQHYFCRGRAYVNT